MPPKNFYSKNKRNFSHDHANEMNKKDNHITVTFLLIGDNKIGIDVPYKAINSDYQLKNIIKSNEGIWDKNQRMWVLLGFKNYHKLLDTMIEHCKKKQYYCSKIPSFVYDAVLNLPLQLLVKISKRQDPPLLKYIETEIYMDPQTLPFHDKLYDFQKQSLVFGIEHHGRMLLADEMGVGKTIQSLAIGFMYRYQWPMVIICPSTLRYNWNNEIFNWYGDHIKKNQVQVYAKGGSALRDTTKILIISYELAWKFKQVWSDFKIAIVDEAHYLKNSGCKRTDILVPQLAKKKRIILLTGTPAFARPREIYNLASIIRPDAFHNFLQFGNRYCQPTRNPWSGSVEYNGCKNSKQLFYILKDRIMLRRLKKDVLTQLPDKQRQKIMIETNKAITKEISLLMDQNGGGINRAEDMIMEMFGLHGNMGGKNQDFQKKRESIMQAYRLSGAAKVEGVVEYILQLLCNDVKLLIFAHHRAILDRIQTQLHVKKYKTIRIDGEVEVIERQNRVDAFQNNKEIMAALLSISAAGVGLTLTASSTVVFAQLHWTPGMMIQAEDRAHRIGQKDCVNCHYLIGQGTLDNILYNYLLKKINNVSTFVDGTEQYLQIQQLSKGQIGKVSKSAYISAKKQKQQQQRDSRKYQITPIHKSININADPTLQPNENSQDTDISSLMTNNPFAELQGISSRQKEQNNDDNETASMQSRSMKNRKRMPDISNAQQYTEEEIEKHVEVVSKNKMRVFSGKVVMQSSEEDSMRTSEIMKLINSGDQIRQSMRRFQTNQQPNQNENVNNSTNQSNDRKNSLKHTQSIKFDKKIKDSDKKISSKKNDEKSGSESDTDVDGTSN